jgi:hypothetical protein
MSRKFKKIDNGPYLKGTYSIVGEGKRNMTLDASIIHGKAERWLCNHKRIASTKGLE